MVFVTHRVATAAMADQVVVLENGEVAGAGTHAELLQSSDTYRQLLGAGEVPDDGRRLRAVPPAAVPPAARRGPGHAVTP